MPSPKGCWSFNHIMNKSPNRSNGNSHALNCASWLRNSKARPCVPWQPDLRIRHRTYDPEHLAHAQELRLAKLFATHGRLGNGSSAWFGLLLELTHYFAQVARADAVS